MNTESSASFARRIIDWQAIHGRHDLPWQASRDPYRIWLSEIMLQQTQVSTVLGYYERFLTRFPSVVDLAAAEPGEVMALWSGLGYYSRARNLHRCAQRVVSEFGGQFPADRFALSSLPGIGRSTAAAIAVFAFDQREAILDGNVKRVLCRHEAITTPAQAGATIKALWQIAEAALPMHDLPGYTQGLMDLGATLCTRSRPDCARCPVASDCRARLLGLTDQIPARRSRPAPATRRITMLVLTRRRAGHDRVDGDAREVLMVQRPDRGIWGGLLSLPESTEAVGRPLAAHLWASGLSRCAQDPAETAATDWRVDEESAPPGATRLLMPIDHAFTHFRLRIEPLLVDLDIGAIEPDGQGRTDLRWLRLDESDTAALPKPVRDLLGGLR